MLFRSIFAELATAAFLRNLASILSCLFVGPVGLGGIPPTQQHQYLKFMHLGKPLDVAQCLLSDGVFLEVFRVVRINLSRLVWQVEEVKIKSFLGGRGVGSWLFLQTRRLLR